jgi:hypothetical protein
MVPSLRVPMSLTIDGELVPTSTTVHWSGAHVLTIATVIARHDLPLALTSALEGRAVISWQREVRGRVDHLHRPLAVSSAETHARMWRWVRRRH